MADYYDHETVLSPEEVLAGVHDQIAARSPEHARMVATYRKLQALPPEDEGRQSQHERRQKRIRQWTWLRLVDRCSKEEAREIMEIGKSTATEYEQEMRSLAGDAR